MQGFVENVNDLLCRSYGLTKVLLTSENRKSLEEEMTCIEINLNCSNKSLRIDSSFLRYDKSYEKTDVSPGNF